MTKMVRQNSFLAGEVDHKNWKRTDIAEYLTAAQSLLNCEVGTTGLAKKRKGTSYKYNATDEAVFNSTMYEFIDKNGLYYIILGGDFNFYVFSVPQDRLDVVTDDDQYVVIYTGQQVTTDDNTVNLIQIIPTPYDGADLLSLDYTNDNDTLILTSPNFPPARIYISNYSPLTFAWQYLNIYPLPSYDYNQINYNNATVALSGTFTSGGTLTVVFTFPSPGIPSNSYTNAWIGGQIIGGGVSEFAPIGYAIIQTVSQSANVVTFTAIVQVAFQNSGYATVGSQYSIRQPTWVQTAGNPYGLGYPAKCLYFQNRLWFGNTALLPNTIFGSKLNQPVSFDVGTGLDTDAIVYTIGQTNAGAILWMNGGKQLEIFCSNYEFACPQNEDIGLTPGTFSVRQQSSYGASTLLKPQTYLNDSYFVQKTGKSAINFHFTGVGLAYASTNISPQSQHLMKNPLNRALLRGSDVSQDNFIYFLNDEDDTLTAFQFATEIKLAALTPIVFQPDVQLIDIVAVNNHVYLLKYYNLTQQFTIERFENEIFIDSAEHFTMSSTGLITQLDRFDGYMVQVVYNNQDYGQYMVEDGQINVVYPNVDNNPLPVNVSVGLLYNVEIVPMYPFFSATSSAFEKKLSRIYIDYYESLNFKINGNLVQYQSFRDVQLGLPLLPRTDTAIFSPFEGYNRFDRHAIVITQSSPFDLQILSIGYQIDMAVI
ncbi:hypothetical protein UFOVP98_10 [uncultured Caudovirales phage]|uniref:Uncharacterized protein n=1 Tax=uncultured Caudovirales phage TaxID=2100421 RepID=A0A6J5L559_9CAUD|nr:hypothetical protein UFOVP98_10 [uncultured Caudovirales phage]CAB4134442.1 hypothetical protein UFOVP269_60 [uncultured Caudovirales phage]